MNSHFFRESNWEWNQLFRKPLLSRNFCQESVTVISTLDITEISFSRYTVELPTSAFRCFKADYLIVCTQILFHVNSPLNFKPSKKVLFMQIRHEMYHEKVNLLHFCLGWVVSIMLLYWYFEEYMVSLYHLAIKSGFYGAVKNFERTVKLTLFFSFSLKIEKGHATTIALKSS